MQTFVRDEGYDHITAFSVVLLYSKGLSFIDHGPGEHGAAAPGRPYAAFFYGLTIVSLFDLC